MEHVTYYVVKKAAKKIDLAVLNDRISNFDYRKHGFSNQPPPISEMELVKKTLKMSASEMMAFVYFFSLLVGDLVSHDEVWFFYLTLRKIVDIVIAPSLQKECADLLDILVSEHHEMYVRLFQDKLKPKHHHMVHYGRVIKTYGPIYHLSVFKFESKNRVMKTRAEAIYSRKNITFTIALVVRRHHNLLRLDIFYSRTKILYEIARLSSWSALANILSSSPTSQEPIRAK